MQQLATALDAIHGALESATVDTPDASPSLGTTRLSLLTLAFSG